MSNAMNSQQAVAAIAGILDVEWIGVEPALNTVTSALEYVLRKHGYRNKTFCSAALYPNGLAIMSSATTANRQTEWVPLLQELLGMAIHDMAKVPDGLLS